MIMHKDTSCLFVQHCVGRVVESHSCWWLNARISMILITDHCDYDQLFHPNYVCMYTFKYILITSQSTFDFFHIQLKPQ